MRTFTILFLLTTLFSCSNKRTENSGIPTTPKTTITFDEINLIDTSAIDAELPRELNISAIDAKFPLKIIEIDFESKSNRIRLEDGIVSRIKQTIKDYADEIGFYDSSSTYKSAYISTLRLQDSSQTVFLVLLHHYPTGMVNSQVLFYDNEKKEFANKSFDFNLHALYDFDNGRLNPTNLKTNFNITSPEIELVDFDKDGVNDFKFTRLFHNGTSNQIYTTILTIKNSMVEPLYFDHQNLGESAER